MTTIVPTGTRVVPGDVLYSVAIHSASKGGNTQNTSDENALSEPRVHAGAGCYTRLSAARTTSLAVNSTTSNKNSNEEAATVVPDMELTVLSSRMGVVQWDGPSICVYPVPSAATTTATTTRSWAAVTPPPLLSGNEASTQSVKQEQLPSEGVTQQGQVKDKEAATSVLTETLSGVTANVFGPRPGDKVHVRITRVARLFAYGEIIAINGTWCCHGRSAGQGGARSAAMPSGAFRGVLRVEDIRPFRPSKEQLQPLAPSLAFQPGDVVLAEVISQSDVRQYQLSTLAESCGVVEAYATYGTRRVALEHLPKRRDAMRSPLDNAVVPRWCPYITL